MTNPEVTQALLPCPFCGGEELSHGYSMPGVDGSARTGEVQCHSCDVLLWKETEVEAIAAWNTRATLTNAPAQPWGEVEHLAEPCWCKSYRHYICPDCAAALTKPAQDVVRLVIAARRVLEAEDWASNAPDRRARMRSLDNASEAFASRVPWDDEPEALTPKQSAQDVGALVERIMASLRDYDPRLYGEEKWETTLANIKPLILAALNPEAPHAD